LNSPHSHSAHASHSHIRSFDEILKPVNSWIPQRPYYHNYHTSIFCVYLVVTDFRYTECIKMSRAGSVVSLSEVFALRPFCPLPPAPRIMPVVAQDRHHCCRKPKSRDIAMAFLCAADTDSMDCGFAASGMMHILKGASNIVFYLRHCHCVFRFFVFHRSCGWLCR